MKFWAGHFEVTVNVKDWQSLQNDLRSRLATGQGFAVATLNLDHLEKLRSDQAFQQAYAAQDFVTADGNPIVWCSALGGQHVNLLPGSDMLVPLAELATAEGRSIGFLGSTADSLTKAAQVLEARIPGAQVVQKIAPPMGFDPNGYDAERMLFEMAAANVGICFVALGAPKQEILAARGRTLAPNVGFASIGASLDFLSGNQIRAPRIVRALAMEWLWRLLSNPRRLARRYGLAFAILPGHLWRSFRSRHN